MTFDKVSGLQVIQVNLDMKLINELINKPVSFGIFVLNKLKVQAFQQYLVHRVGFLLYLLTLPLDNVSLTTFFFFFKYLVFIGHIQKMLFIVYAIKTRLKLAENIHDPHLSRESANSKMYTIARNTQKQITELL